MPKIKKGNISITKSGNGFAIMNLIPNMQHQSLDQSKKEVYCMSKDPNTIYVGTKPAMSYVLVVITHFNDSDAKEVTLNARGRAITTYYRRCRNSPPQVSERAEN